MIFRDALAQVKPGQYIKRKNMGWTEYFIQYGKNNKGELFWTGGNTVGGPLTLTMRRRENHRGNTDWCIYDCFYDKVPAKE